MMTALTKSELEGIFESPLAQALQAVDPYAIPGMSLAPILYELETAILDKPSFDDVAKKAHEMGFGTYELVETYGGEGKGDEYYWILKHTADDGTETFVKVIAYYSSWDGLYTDDVTLIEVEPVPTIAYVPKR